MIYTVGLKYLRFRELTLIQSINGLQKLDIISLDLETTGLNPWSDKLLLLILGNENLQIVINCRDCKEEDITQIINSIKDKKIIIHNSKFDYRFIKVKYGIELKDLYCTMLVSQILYNGHEVKNDLKSICKRFLGIDLSKETRKSFINKPSNELFTESEVKYAANDIKLLNRLKTAQKHYIDKYGMSYLIDLENRLTPILANIELKGIDLNENKWREVLNKNIQRHSELVSLMDDFILKLAKELNLKIDKLTNKRRTEKSIQVDIFGKEELLVNKNLNNINYNSHTQVRELFDIIGEKLESTSEDSLKNFRRKNKNSKLLELVDLLLEYREVSTEINVFGEKFLKYINSHTGRIHTSFTQCTRSGRLTSGDEKNEEGKKSFSYVNFQNIPHKEKFRECFIAPEGYSFLTADYSSQEVTIAASDSQDDLLLRSINDGIDMHSLLAMESFKIIHGREEEISKTKNKEFRNLHKNLTFAIFYQGGYGNARDILDISENVAKRVHANILKMLPKFTARMKYLGNFAQENGFITANKITNRRRWFTNEEPYKLVKEAANFPIQASGADQIKESLIEIDKYLKDKDAWICNTVHDEICVIYGNKLEELPNVIKNIMEECANKYLTGVKMAVDIKVNEHWEK